MKRKKVYYFAFGSNMSRERLNRRMRDFVPSAGTYKMKGWKLTLNCATKAHWCSFANIEEGGENDFVEGVLYELDHRQLSSLDDFEGLYERVYFDLPEFGEDALLCTYIGYPRNVNNEVKPDLEYLNTCIEGALQHGLIHTYNLLVDFKNKNYTLLKGNKFRAINNHEELDEILRATMMDVRKKLKKSKRKI